MASGEPMKTNYEQFTGNRLEGRPGEADAVRSLILAGGEIGSPNLLND